MIFLIIWEEQIRELGFHGAVAYIWFGENKY